MILAYLLPVQRLLNSYSRDRLSPDQETYINFVKKLWALLPNVNNAPGGCLPTGEELFRLATLTQQVTSWWYAADEYIENPETGESQHINTCISDCEELFPGFQQRYNDDSLFMSNCIGIALYDVAYLLLHGTDGHYYGYDQFLYHLCEQFDNDAESRLENEEWTSEDQKYLDGSAFLQNIHFLKEDVTVALSADDHLEVNGLLEKYKDKTFYFSAY